MDPSMSSEFSVLNHTPRCLSLRQHPYYPLHECMDPDTDMTVAMTDMQQAGALSLHHYRKTLYSDPDDCVVLDVRGRKKLRRKNGASNLQTPSASTTSSPPPLSPCYSTTISLASQRSEADYDFMSRTSSPMPLEYPFPRRISNRFNTFRDRLRKPLSVPRPQQSRTSSLNALANANANLPGHSKASSDSILLDVKRSKATMVHQGTSFEILNPHESLNFARIVSYIEDVDYSSRSSEEMQRESFLSNTSGCTAVSAMVVTQEQRSRSASPAATAAPAPAPVPGTETETKTETGPEDGSQQTHTELVGDAAHVPMPSISERLATSPDQSDLPDLPDQSCARDRADTNNSNGSEIGEPGSVVDYGAATSSSSSSSVSLPKDLERECPTACSYSRDLLDNRNVQQPTPDEGVRARPQSGMKKRPFTRLRGGLARALPFLRRKRD